MGTLDTSKSLGFLLLAVCLRIKSLSVRLVIFMVGPSATREPPVMEEMLLAMLVNSTCGTVCAYISFARRRRIYVIALGFMLVKSRLRRGAIGSCSLSFCVMCSGVRGCICDPDRRCPLNFFEGRKPGTNQVYDKKICTTDFLVLNDYSATPRD